MERLMATYAPITHNAQVDKGFVQSYSSNTAPGRVALDFNSEEPSNYHEWSVADACTIARLIELAIVDAEREL
jgi:hypothetical protein